MKIFKRRIDGGETFLPDEIMEKILLKLPIKSLLRFKSVHKRWLYLISHPKFVQSQLKHVLSVDDERKIMALSSDGSHFYVLNQHGKTIDHKYNLPSAWKGFASVSASSVFIYLLGSCNGLLCIAIYSYFNFDKFNVDCNLIIWNPVLNDYKKVPFSVLFAMNMFGFGYDSHTQDYKIVSMIFTEYAEVFSFKSSSKRKLPFPPNMDFSSMRYACGGNGRFFNGSLYWLCGTRSYEAPNSFIEQLRFLVFDLRYEKFRIVKFPNYTVPKEGGNFATVRDCNGLGVFFYDDKYINLVTMKQDEKEEENCCWSFIKIRQPEGNISYPLCFMRDIEEILVGLNNKFPNPEYPNNGVFIYNPQQRTMEVAAAELHKPEDRYEPDSQFITYIQTLVSPSKL